MEVLGLSLYPWPHVMCEGKWKGKPEAGAPASPPRDHTSRLLYTPDTMALAPHLLRAALVNTALIARSKAVAHPLVVVAIDVDIYEIIAPII